MFQLAQLSWSGALIVRLVPNLKWCFPPVPRLHTASEPASEGNESLGTRQPISYGTHVLIEDKAEEVGYYRINFKTLR